jgi:hypothetical protein
MLANGEQKIFIWIDFTPETEVTILHGVQVAMILEKEVCLIHHPGKGNRITEDAESRLFALAIPVAQILGPEKVHHFITMKPMSEILTELAEEYDTLLLVAHKKNSKELLPHLPHSGFPFLFVSAGLDAEISYRRIAVPVGYMKKCKDLALWSSYFGRHNGARITLFKAKESFEEDNRVIMSNLSSITRLFRNFNFTFEIEETGQSSWKIQKTALEHALVFLNGLLIISFTHRSTFLDRIFRLDDAFVINHSENLSVMCINSQRDLYTLCG